MTGVDVIVGADWDFAKGSPLPADADCEANCCAGAGLIAGWSCSCVTQINPKLNHLAGQLFRPEAAKTWLE
jgi:hypothetical protein